MKPIEKIVTFELKLKGIWQHPATGKHLEKPKIVWGEVEKSIIITVRNLSQSQSGTWKILIKQDTEELISLLSSLVNFSKLPSFSQAHPLQKQLMEELIFNCQSLTLSTGRPSSTRPQTRFRASTEKQRLENFHWHLCEASAIVRRPFLTTGSRPTSFIKNSTSFHSSGATTVKFLPPFRFSAHKAGGLILRLTFIWFICFLPS